VKKIFIGGCDRSGTTLLASMLSRLEGAIATPESQFKLELLDAGTGIQSAKNLWRLKVWGIAKYEILALENSGENREDLLESLVTKYATRRGIRPDVWIDHTPDNMYSISTLLRHLNDATFVHIIRDGRAVAGSVIPLDWGPNSSREAAVWWSRKLSFGLAGQKAIPERVTTVRYEDLIRNPVAELKRLCGFLRLNFSEEMLEANGYSVPVYTRKQHELIGRKPNIRQLTAWRQKLSPKEIEQFEYIAGPILELLGYSCDFDYPSAPTRKDRLFLCLRESYFRNLHRRLRRKLHILLANSD
jgi:hypothetical protein